MKNITICLLISCFLSSCGLFKKTTLNKDAFKSDSIQNSELSAHKVDKSVITIREKVDTAVRVPGYQQAAQWKLNRLLPGQKFNGFETSVKNIDSSFTDVKLYYDSLSNAVNVLVKAKDQLIPVSFDRTTVINKDITSDSTASHKTQVKISQDHTAKTSTPDYSWLIYAAIAAIILFAFYKISNRIKG